MTGTKLLAMVVATASFSTAHAQTVGPCADDGWGHIDSASAALHVRAGGDDVNGNGTAASPFASVARAVQAARGLPVSQRRIAVGPGEFATAVVLDQATDAGLVVQGCGADQTVLSGGSSAPVLDVATSGAVSVEGLGLSGGLDALTIRGGATATVTSVDIDSAYGRGLVVAGATTTATLDDVTVRDTQGACGWGAAITGATVQWSGGGVDGAAGVGIFADGADLTLTDVDVAGTATAGDGTLGRGLHAQYSRLRATGGTFDGNHDASIFVLDPLGDGWISGVVINFPGAGVVINFPGAGRSGTGEGVVVKSTGLGDGIDLSDNVVIGAPRAAILIDGADVVMSGNAASGTGLYGTHGAHFFSQNGASVAGSDADEVVALSPSEALPIGGGAISCTP